MSVTFFNVIYIIVTHIVPSKQSWYLSWQITTRSIFSSRYAKKPPCRGNLKVRITQGSCTITIIFTQFPEPRGEVWKEIKKTSFASGGVSCNAVLVLQWHVSIPALRPGTMSDVDRFFIISGTTLYSLATNAVFKNYSRHRQGLDEFPEHILFDIIFQIYLRSCNPKYRNERVKRWLRFFITL